MYLDLTGPKEVTSAGGTKYIMILIDDHSSMKWIYLLKEKSQAKDVFIKWRALVENETGQKVKHTSAQMWGGNTRQPNLSNTCESKALNTN